MNQIEQEALEFFLQFQSIYFEKENKYEVFEFLDKNIEWISIENHKVCYGFDETYKFLTEEENMFHNTCLILDSKYEVSSFTSDCCFIYGTLDIGNIFNIVIRISALCHKTSAGMKIRQIHISLPIQENFSPMICNSKNINSNLFDMNTLTNNIPGGVMCCDWSDKLNLLQYSEGFLSMFGYTAEDIKTLFNNQFINMIYPEDIEETDKSVREQMAKGNTKEIEYRIICKDNSLIWVLDRGQLIKRKNGDDVFCCILIDITETKNALENLRLSLERYQIVMNQATDIIFEWDINKDSLVCSSNWEKKFGYKPILENISSVIQNCGKFFPEDIPKLLKLMEDVSKGLSYAESEFRIKNKDEIYIWCRMRVTLQVDEKNNPSKLIGIISDIDEEKKNTQKLKQKAERDTLTGLYNKGTTQSLIENYLNNMKKETIAAFLIIDVDNFKQINDTFGHLSGDVMLSDVSDALQKQFRNSDIIGRIGGDEFAVFMKNITDYNVIFKKAENILNVFRNLLSPHMEKMKLSCSIGISIAQKDGIDFQSLYKNADIALYYAKINGKNKFEFYSEALNDFNPDNSINLNLKRSSVGNKIDSENGVGALNSKIAEYVFKVLYQTQDIETALPKILEIIGLQFDVSRVYIFEDSDDEKYTVNTFEWCAEGITAQKENLQHVVYSCIGNYYNNFNDNGIFYCRNIHNLPKTQIQLFESQNIKSLIQCQIRDNGVVKGFIGFDECRNLRFWTKDQIDILSFIAEIVSVFLLKKRAQIKTFRAINSLETILDYQNSYIFVLDKNTYQILYANKKLFSAIPKLKIGVRCYEAFFDNNQICEKCPIKELNISKTSSAEMYINILKTNVLINVTEILWSDGKSAYLLSCHEINFKGDSLL